MQRAGPAQPGVPAFEAGQGLGPAGPEISEGAVPGEQERPGIQLGSRTGVGALGKPLLGEGRGLIWVLQIENFPENFEFEPEFRDVRPAVIGFFFFPLLWVSPMAYPGDRPRA